MRKQKRTFIAGMLLALVLGSGLSLTEAAETAPDGTQILYNSPDGKPLATETKEQAPAQTEDQMKISINLAARSLASTARISPSLLASMSPTVVCGCWRMMSRRFSTKCRSVRP